MPKDLVQHKGVEDVYRHYFDEVENEINKEMDNERRSMSMLSNESKLI